MAQPIVRLDDMEIIGYEALARVDSDPVLGPDRWLAGAEAAGRRTELELEFLKAAANLGAPPGDAWLFVNVSPAALGDPSLLTVRSRLPERLVLEITEQATSGDIHDLKEQIEPWARGQARFAIDDTGAGYSSLERVVELSPDFLKLDRSLIQGLDRDPHRAALVRALVAFAREVGTNVIAEGIETAAELAALKAARVPLGQGYFLARPAAPWPSVVVSYPPVPSSEPARLAALRQALADATDAGEACEAVVAHLFSQGRAMPSLYLEQDGHLRCVAQRGLWQVLDGLPADGGVTGRVWSTGVPMEVHDVSASADYLEAVPGVVAEMCVPVTAGGTVIGALNVDLLVAIRAGFLGHLQAAADLLSDRLGSLGWSQADSPWHRAVHGSVAISAAAADHDAPDKIIAAFRSASGLDSAGLVRLTPEGPRVVASAGPLIPMLRSLSDSSLASLCRLVENLSSCYTGSEATGLPYIGSEAMQAAGARAMVMLPLRANNVGLGIVILAHTKPVRLGAGVIEPLELLAGQAAAMLNSVDLVEQLRRQASRDGLTGLRNRLSLDHDLEACSNEPRTVIIVDVDHFKVVNDVYGHPGGDAALRALAGGLTSWLPEESFYRLGGDELTCIRAGAHPERAREIGEAILATARRVLAPWRTSVSVGAAVSGPGETSYETLARADQALLWSKRYSRGTVVVAGDRGFD